MAEWSKAPRLGRGPQGREFEPHYRHEMVLKLRFLIEYIQNDFFSLVPVIAQLVERSTVANIIEWSLVQFRVAGII